jgi:hypothetical protein
MYHQEEMRDAWKGEVPGYASYEEAFPYSSAGQKLMLGPLVRLLQPFSAWP